METRKQVPEKCVAELCGELIGCLLVLAVYLTVPVLILGACVKIIFF
jgi:hypothetical protein